MYTEIFCLDPVQFHSIMYPKTETFYVVTLEFCRSSYIIRLNHLMINPRDLLTVG